MFVAAREALIPFDFCDIVVSSFDEKLMQCKSTPLDGIMVQALVNTILNLFPEKLRYVSSFQQHKVTPTTSAPWVASTPRVLPQACCILSSDSLEPEALSCLSFPVSDVMSQMNVTMVFSVRLSSSFGASLVTIYASRTRTASMMLRGISRSPI